MSTQQQDGEVRIDTEIAPYPLLYEPGNPHAWLQLQYCYDLKEWQ